jgi:hypothetical protein
MNSSSSIRETMEHAPAPSTGAIRLSSDLLTPHFRPVRLPLSLWARALLKRVRRDRPIDRTTSDEAFERISSAFNEAALIDVHIGRPVDALTLCRTSIAMTAAAVELIGRASFAQFAFQPYINEARLDRLHGRWDIALEKFRRLESFLGGDTVEIGRLEITADRARAIAQANPAFRDRMHANFVVDSAATLLRASRFDEALTFSRAYADVAVDSLPDLLQETALVSFARLGDAGNAMGIAETYLRHLFRSNRQVFLCRRAELLAAAEDDRSAAHIGRQLTQAQIAADPRGGMNLRLLLLVARLLTRVSDPMALTAARAGLDASERIEDVIFQQGFLGLLAELEPEPDDRLAARTRAEVVVRDGWYGRDADARPQDCAGRDVIDLLHERLLTLAGMPPG